MVPTRTGAARRAQRSEHPPVVDPPETLPGQRKLQPVRPPCQPADV